MPIFSASSAVTALVYGLQFVGLWMVFREAGRSGWEALIPFCSLFVLVDILDRSDWRVLRLLVPIVIAALRLIVCLDLAGTFGRGTWFAAGLFLLPYVFLLIIGFGAQKFVGRQPAKVGRLDF
jgi:Family of unknown function (DUF5684)